MIKRVSETNKNEAKEQKGGFLSMLLGRLGASLIANLIIGKVVIRAEEDTIRNIPNFSCWLIFLTNFEIQKYYQNEPKFDVVYSVNNLAK